MAFVSCKGGSEYAREARERAVLAAQALVASDHSDTIGMEGLILEAKAVQSEYMLKGDTIAVQEFDKAFREYVEVNDPELAKELF